MSRSELPQGVSPTNEKPSFDARNMATSELAVLGILSAPRTRAKHKFIHQQHEFVEQVADDEYDSAGDRAAKIQPGPIMVILVIAGLLTALAAIIFANNRQPTPLCSDQPEWNQYNCRSG